MSTPAKNKKTTKRLSKSEYEKLGRTLESIFEGGYINHFRVYKINFIRGIFFGLGTFIGGTIVITSFIWFLTLFEEAPLVGDLVDNIKAAVNSE